MKELEYILFRLIANGILYNIVDCSTDDYEVVEIFGLGSGNIDLKYQKNEVFIKVHAIEDITAEELEAKVFPEINQIVDKLSFFTNTCIDMEENIQIVYKYKSIEKLIKKDIPRSQLTLLLLSIKKCTTLLVKRCTTLIRNIGPIPRAFIVLAFESFAYSGN